MPNHIISVIQCYPEKNVSKHICQCLPYDNPTRNKTNMTKTLNYTSRAIYFVGYEKVLKIREKLEGKLNKNKNHT